MFPEWSELRFLSKAAGGARGTTTSLHHYLNVVCQDRLRTDKTKVERKGVFSVPQAVAAAASRCASLWATFRESLSHFTICGPRSTQTTTASKYDKHTAHHNSRLPLNWSLNDNHFGRDGLGYIYTYIYSFIFISIYRDPREFGKQFYTTFQPPT